MEIDQDRRIDWEISEKHLTLVEDNCNYNNNFLFGITLHGFASDFWPHQDKQQ